MNKDKIKEQKKEHYQLNKEHLKEHYQLNKEHLKEYRQLNKDAINKRRRELSALKKAEQKTNLVNIMYI